MKLLSFLRGYLGTPFPKATGFSAYRMPGLAVHGPVIVASLLVGLAFAGGQPAALPLLLACGVVGTYVGRDVAIAAHYIPPITLAVWAGFFGVLIAFQRVTAFARLWTASVPSLPWLATFGLACAFVAYLGLVYWRSRD